MTDDLCLQLFLLFCQRTTTAEGQILAQVCSTFSRGEQARFEAFRRSAFPADAISKYVAHCLIEEHGGDMGESRRRIPRLSELCANGQAEEIAIVVSTLAKSYAQRLVTAARQLCDNPEQPIQPEQILEALHARQAKGLDPGFFLQPATSNIRLMDESFPRKRLAALQAQEEFDKLQTKPGADHDGDDEPKGDSSSSSGEEDFMDLTGFTTTPKST